MRIDKSAAFGTLLLFVSVQGKLDRTYIIENDFSINQSHTQSTLHLILEFFL